MKKTTSDLLAVKTVTLTAKGQIALPQDIQNLKGYIKGEKIAILAYTDRIELRPMKHIAEKLGTAFASEKVLAKGWLSPADEEQWKNL